MKSQCLKIHFDLHRCKEQITEQKQHENQNLIHVAQSSSAGEFFFPKAGRFKISLRHRAISLIYDPFSLSLVRPIV